MRKPEMEKEGVADFASMVAAARREIEAAGPWVVPVATKKKKKGKAGHEKKASAQGDLEAAVLACDARAAQAAVEDGADPCETLCGSMGLFEAWVGMVARRGQDGSNPGVESAAAKEMILWIDGQNVTLLAVTGNKEAKRLGAERAARSADPASRKACRIEEMIGLLDWVPVSSCPVLGEALGELAQHWGLDAQPKARVGPQAWMDELFKTNGEWLASEALAVELGRRGARMSAEQWREMGARLLCYPDDMAPAMMCDLLRTQPLSLGVDEETLGLLMAHALFTDSLGELSEVSSKCEKPLWRLPTDVWEEMDLSVPAHGQGPTLLEYAARLACDGDGQEKMARTGVATGMNCLRALARIPQAIASLDGPEPGVFDNASMAMMLLMEESMPSMLAPDAQGETFAHSWARGAEGWGGPEKVVALLKTKMAPWALRENKKGESAVSIVKASCKSQKKISAKMDKAFSAYERRSMEEEVPAGRDKGAQHKARRL